MTRRPTISAVINTLNEETNLGYALTSVQDWVDEIVVVDMHSDDDTRRIARDYGAKVFLHERTSAVDGARAFALSQVTSDWIVLLDADELVPARLAVRLREIAINDEADVVDVPFANYLLGARLRYTAWGPHQDHHIRFFKKSAVSASSRIHAFLHPMPRSRILRLPADVEGFQFVHFNYLGIEHFLTKLNRYTSVEAVQARDRGERATVASAVVAGIRAFGSRFVRHLGYRDGWRGFVLSVLMGVYAFTAKAKLLQLQRVGSDNDVREAYARLAHQVLNDDAPAEAPGVRKRVPED